MPTDAGLIDPTTPPNQLPATPVIHGDAHSKDADVLNSQFEQAAIPPIPEELPKVDIPKEYITVPGLTRLLTGSMVIPNTWGPVCILPADFNRKRITLWATSATATDVLMVADDSGKVQYVSSAALLGVGEPVELGEYNGPIWVSCASAVGPVTLSWAAVTA